MAGVVHRTDESNLTCTMEDDVRRDERLPDIRTIADIAPDKPKLILPFRLQAVQVLPDPVPRQVVEDRYAVTGGQESGGQIRADKPGSACNQVSPHPIVAVCAEPVVACGDWVPTRRQDQNRHATPFRREALEGRHFNPFTSYDIRMAMPSFHKYATRIKKSGLSASLR